MDAQVVIDSYIESVATRLPRRLRNDVGLELQQLLTEQLTAAAADSGRAPDEKLAIEVVRSFGRPEEVAARYSPRGFEIIAPEHVPAFITLSVVCVVTQWALTLPAVFAARTTLGEWWLSWGFGAFAWVGALLVWFAVSTWARRRVPVDWASSRRPWWYFVLWLPVATDWQPVDREGVERRTELGAFPLGVIATIFLIAPAWFLRLLTPARTNVSWALYDEHFRRTLLPVLIALMVVRLALCAAGGMSSRLRTQLAGLRLTLWVSFVGLLCWTLFAWHIFAWPVTDVLFKAWLAIYVLVNIIAIALRIRREVMRVRIPTTRADA